MILLLRYTTLLATYRFVTGTEIYFALPTLPREHDCETATFITQVRKAKFSKHRELHCRNDLGYHR